MSERIRILVVGSGAREHALIAAMASSTRVSEILALPGNAGIAVLARCLPGRADDVAAIVASASAERIDLVVVGPEAPLVAGVVDALGAVGIMAFGPSAQAARLEGSKVFCKHFMKRYGIATARYEVFDDPDAAERWLRGPGQRAGWDGFVVKADGLAAGKGVVVASTVEEACAAVDAMMRRRLFGDAGATVVVEERLRGREVSFHALCDGERFVALAAAQDHKRIFDGDHGPNTGGMGAYSPPETVPPEVHRRIVDEVIAKAVEGSRLEGCPFRGVLFAGLMLCEGPKPNEPRIEVLEFNVRFGDPETAVLMARLEGDLVPYLEAAARGDLSGLVGLAPPITAEPAVGVVLAAAGYPETPRLGDPIEGLAEAASVEGVTVLHAGTADRDGLLVSSGGRVLCVTARGTSVDEAAARAYRALGRIALRGGQYRSDIAAAARRRPDPR